MTISIELANLITKLQYDENEKFDVKLYRLMKKMYFRESFDFDDFIYIRGLSKERSNDFLNYVYLCNPEQRV
jgi:hypothetical protein